MIPVKVISEGRIPIPGRDGKPQRVPGAEVVTEQRFPNRNGWHPMTKHVRPAGPGKVNGRNVRTFTDWMGTIYYAN